MNSTTTTTGGDAETIPQWQKVVGIILALASGVLIGSSVVFTKRGLQQTRSHEAGREHAYLRNGMWWIGMVMMGLGECSNFGAYAFAPAILVTPLGAVSVVISAVFSSLFLKEYLSFAAKIGCAQCIIGAIIIVLHAPSQTSTQTIPEFFSYVISPGFLSYTCLIAILLAFLLLRIVPRYASRTPLVYISISSLIGSYLVLSTQGFGSSLVYSIRNPSDNQFLLWPIYPLFAFIIGTIVTQIHFLNRALSLYSAAVVTPVYYVCFTTATLVASAVLFRGFPVDSLASGLSIVMGFTVIVGGVALLFQFSADELRAIAALAPPPGAPGSTTSSMQRRRHSDGHHSVPKSPATRSSSVTESGPRPESGWAVATTDGIDVIDDASPSAAHHSNNSNNNMVMSPSTVDMDDDADDESDMHYYSSPWGRSHGPPSSMGGRRSTLSARSADAASLAALPGVPTHVPSMRPERSMSFNSDREDIERAIRRTDSAATGGLGHRRIRLSGRKRAGGSGSQGPQPRLPTIPPSPPTRALMLEDLAREHDKVEEEVDLTRVGGVVVVGNDASAPTTAGQSDSTAIDGEFDGVPMGRS